MLRAPFQPRLVPASFPANDCLSLGCFEQGCWSGSSLPGRSREGESSVPLEKWTLSCARGFLITDYVLPPEPSLGPDGLGRIRWILWREACCSLPEAAGRAWTKGSARPLVKALRVKASVLPIIEKTTAVGQPGFIFPIKLVLILIPHVSVS